MPPSLSFNLEAWEMAKHEGQSFSQPLGSLSVTFYVPSFSPFLSPACPNG